MLPPYIIEEIRKREEERKRRERWPRVELPMEPPMPGSDPWPVEKDSHRDQEEISTEVDYSI
jgi:hypothetical protein